MPTPQHLLDYWWLLLSVIVCMTLLLYHGFGLIPSFPQPHKAYLATITPVVKPEAKAASQSINPILDVFQPPAESISKRQSISRLRAELEQFLVIRALLHHCNLIREEEHLVLLQAATAYASQHPWVENAQALMAQVNTSAIQTFSLVYAQTDCSDASLQSLKIQSLSWAALFTKPLSSPSR